MQKADIQPTDGKQPDHVAIDETVIQLTDQRYWLNAAVDPDTNEFLYVRLYPTRTTALTEMFLTELTEKHDVEEPYFSSIRRHGSKLHFIVTGSNSTTKNTEIGTLSNISLKR